VFVDVNNDNDLTDADVAVVLIGRTLADIASTNVGLF